MRVAVVMKQVPDLVEELVVAPDGMDIDRSVLTFKLNEFDDYALEEALQLKERAGAGVPPGGWEVVALALDGEGADQLLYTALARGADRALLVSGAPEDARTNRVAAGMFAAALRALEPDLVLAGVQAADDLDGQVGVLVAAALGLPHASVIAGVEVDAAARRVRMTQEFGGGLVADLEGELPLVLGIQASRETPRYAPITRIRQAMSSGKLETVAVDAPLDAPHAEVRGFAAPEAASHAEMLDGAPAGAAERLVAILRERGFGGKR